MKIQEEGKTIYLSELTPVEEEKLRDLSTKEDPAFSMSHAIEGYIEASKVTYSEIVAQFVCSSCREPIGQIANGWPLHIFRKIKGFYCRNSQCEFYRKFIPIKKGTSLISIMAMPMLHLATEEYIREHPEFRLENRQ